MLIGGRFRLLRPIGRGAASVVYQAQDIECPKRELALKLATPKGTAAAENRHEYECRLARSIRHPNIALTFGAGRVPETGQSYIVMERVRGADFFRGTDGLSCQDLCEVVAQLCRALRFLHHRGYAHGDLKPANVKIDWRGNNPTVKLLDLGLSWRISEVAASEARGTLAYIAPEMLSARPVDSRCDLYSLGVMLYEAIAGHKPFRAEGADFLAHTRTAPPPIPETPRLAVAHQVWKLVLALLEKSPDARPSSAEVIKALAEAIGQDLPVETPETAQAYVRSLPYYGRHDELAKWESRMIALQGGVDAPRALAVTGGWGTGKTALLGELAGRAELCGLRTFRLRCALTPEEPVTSPRDLFQRVRASARRTPCAVFVDDLHRLHDEDFSAFDGLLRAAASRQLLVAFACSEDRVHDGPIARLLSEHDALEQMQLGPLASGVLDQMIRDAVPGRATPEFAARLTSHVCGNPLFLVETLAGIAASQVSMLASSVAPIFTPDMVQIGSPSLLDLVQERVRGLRRGLKMLRFCALMRRAVSVQLLTELMGLSTAEVSDIGEELRRLGLAQHWDLPSGPAIAITQETVARYVEQKLPEEEAATLHRRLAEVVVDKIESAERYGFPPADAMVIAAEHFLASGEKARASDLAFRAAVRFADIGENEKAARSARLALRSDCLPEVERRDALELLGDAMAALGHGRASVEAIQTAIGLVTPATTETETKVRLQRKLAQAMLLRQTPTAAIRVLERARHLAGQLAPASKEKALVEGAVGEALIESGETARAVSQLKLAVDFAEVCGDMRTKAAVSRLLGTALGRSGRYSEAYERLRYAKELFQKIGDQSGVAAATVAEASVLRREGHMANAERLYLEAIASREALGEARALARACHNLATLYHAQCKWSRAHEFYGRSIQLKEQLGLNTAASLCNLAIAAVSAAQIGAALRAAQEAVREAEHGASALLPDALVQVAHAYYHVGELGLSEEAIARARDRLQERDQPHARESVHLILGHCHRLRGRYDRAAKHYARSLAIGRATRSDLDVQDALSWLACVHLLEGRAQTALAVASEAMDAGRQGVDSTHAVGARSQYAKCLLAAGRADEAVRHLVETYATTERMRIPLWKAEVAAVLAEWYLGNGDLAYFCHYISQCLDVFDVVAADLRDEGLKRTFLDDPRRQEAFGLMRKAKERYGI